MRLIIVLAIIVALLILGFVAWLTAFSVEALLAGVILVILLGVLLAARASIVNLPALAKKLIGWGIAICLIIISWAGIIATWQSYKEWSKQEAKNLQNSAICKNENGSWVSIPGGHFKNADGGCEEGEEPARMTLPPTTRASAEKQYVEVDRCDTDKPCFMEVASCQKFDTGGKPYRVKFNKRDKWYEGPGDGTPIPAEVFNTGRAEFASAKGKPPMTIVIKELR